MELELLYLKYSNLQIINNVGYFFIYVFNVIIVCRLFNVDILGLIKKGWQFVIYVNLEESYS